MADSTLGTMNRLDRQITGLLAALDVDLLGRETSRIIAHIKQITRDARLDIRDWEMAQSRQEMTDNANAASNRLEELRKYLLRGSEHGIFSAITIVDLSSQLDAIQADLR